MDNLTLEQHKLAAEAALATLVKHAAAIRSDADTTYYQSLARPRDEAAHERLKGVAEAIDRHRRKKTNPTPDDLAKWSEILWRNGKAPTA